ncbi:MAG: hypothetical protein AAB359_07960 [Elusimicrobiota bacterium]
MTFFRLRVINTLLLFLIGIVLGFILKDKFYPAARTPAQTAYPASYPGRVETPHEAQPETEEPTDEPYAVQDVESVVSAPRAGGESGRESAAQEEPEALVIEAAGTDGGSRDTRQPVLKSAQDVFFKNPATYEGRELEMELQMIMAKKSQRGWRVNLVYTSPDKKTDYLYVDDSELLGEKPDLRIGYVYKIRFLAGKGEIASGNTLLEISPTGEKAAWATGIPAVE